jgi:hypothetical protein
VRVEHPGKTSRLRADVLLALLWLVAVARLRVDDSMGHPSNKCSRVLKDVAEKQVDTVTAVRSPGTSSKYCASPEGFPTYEAV